METAALEQLVQDYERFVRYLLEEWPRETEIGLRAYRRPLEIAERLLREYRRVEDT